MLSRSLTVFILYAYDYENHKDFHGLSVIDENLGLTQNLMLSPEVSKMHNTSTMLGKTTVLEASPLTFLIEVMDQFLNKINPDGEFETYFIVQIKLEGQKIIDLEKTYRQFCAFRNELEFSLRGSGLNAPPLDSEFLNNLMPSSDELFK